MAADNAAQISDWNGAVGQQWAALQQNLDAMIMPFGLAALDAAAVKSGQHVVDIGCGCGDTSLSLARSVGPMGLVLGVDVSQPMLEVAHARAAAANLPNLSFKHADASDTDLNAGNDLLFSRFGVMFFGQPVAAFRQMRKSLRPEGRSVFVCWRTPRDNPWAMTPLIAARQALGITPEPADPFAPGPFAFADETRLGVILQEAGLKNIVVRRFDAEVTLGPSPMAAAESAARVGPVARLLREIGDAHLPVVLNAIESSFSSCAKEDGEVCMKGSVWIVSAENPR